MLVGAVAAFGLGVSVWQLKNNNSIDISKHQKHDPTTVPDLGGKHLVMNHQEQLRRLVQQSDTRLKEVAD
jgi:hypothetical protein